MAKNITYKPGNHISAPVPAGTKSGAPLRIGGLNAVAVTDRAEVGVPAVLADGTKNPAYNHGGGNPQGHASVWFEAAPEVKVTSGAAITFGAPVYITPAGALNTTASGNTLWGHSVDPSPTDNGDGTFNVVVRINN